MKVFLGETVPYSLFSSSRPPVQKKGWLSPDSRAIKCSVFSALSKDTIAIFLDWQNAWAWGGRGYHERKTMSANLCPGEWR